MLKTAFTNTFVRPAVSRHRTGIVDTENASPLGQHGGFELEPRSILHPLPPSPILSDMDTIWDMRKFAVARHPVEVATLNLKDMFSRAGAICCTDMPIKFPGSNIHRIPIEQAQFCEALQNCIDFENAANPGALEKYFAYLTIDQKFIKRGQAQRGIGLHSDSIQGPRISPKTEIEHTYLCVDRDPTLFFAQPFDLDGYDVNRHWLNAAFQKQARPESAISAKCYGLNLIDAYTVHTAIPAAEDGRRTLLRLIYSVRRFDRAGNTHNNLFDYQWDMQPRPLPANLELLR